MRKPRKAPVKLEKMKTFFCSKEHIQKLKQQCAEKKKGLFSWEVPHVHQQ